MLDTDSMRNAEEKRKAFNESRTPRRSGLREQHAEATRLALLTAASARFAQHGYAHTSLDDVAADAGTTKGAVYHHFKDKQALFAATYEHLSAALVEALVRHPQMASGEVADAIAAFLELAPHPGYSRVLFLEGPAVLGPAACRAIDMRHGLGLMEALVSRFITPEVRSLASTSVLTRLMLATLIEAVQMIASEPDAAAAAAVARQARHVLDRSFGALAAPR